MDKITDIVIEIEKLKADQKFSTAIELLEKSIIQYNDDYRLYEELSDIYLFKGELDKALKSINHAISLNKESATGYLKGFILLSQDKVTDAIKYLEKSNELLWNNSEVLRNLGWAYTLEGHTEKGILILKRALNLAPGDELITEDLAMALIGFGKITEWNDLLKKIWKKIMS
jgi:tetratricopeptide (TPR) repeat protein